MLDSITSRSWSPGLHLRSETRCRISRSVTSCTISTVSSSAMISCTSLPFDRSRACNHLKKGGEGEGTSLITWAVIALPT